MVVLRSLGRLLCLCVYLQWQFVSYDLGDCTKWEFIFTGLDKPILQIPDVHNELTFDDEDEV